MTQWPPFFPYFWSLLLTTVCSLPVNTDTVPSCVHIAWLVITSTPHSVVASFLLEASYPLVTSTWSHEKWLTVIKHWSDKLVLSDAKPKLHRLKAGVRWFLAVCYCWKHVILMFKNSHVNKMRSVMKSRTVMRSLWSEPQLLEWNCC